MTVVSAPLIVWVVVAVLVTLSPSSMTPISLSSIEFRPTRNRIPVWSITRLLAPTERLICSIAVMVADVVLMWRSYKRLLAERHPGTPLRGLLMYGFNRQMTFRRWRRPAPRIKRGEAY